jgi:hypothetical protein
VTNSSALKVGGLRKIRQHSVIYRMPNWGLTIYSEFIDVMSLLGYACMVMRCYRATSQLASGRAMCTINIICVRFNAGVTQKPRNFNWYPQ